MSGTNRRGSALLVVLGMISFMVISAVAFSAYMRYSRLPSSFLRQTSATRLLIKAALANAIDEIDAAIGNNPHPGIGNGAYAYPRSGGGSYNRNTWIGRVYMASTNGTTWAAESETVATLSLEGLAYLPPPLVNEARYYSRRSFAGTWHRMNFDAGRYAFCAVDVSDYFDVNALEASSARSSEPASRVSLSYLFEPTDHSSASGGPLGTAEQWESFMQTIRSSQVPLVSLADWNLAMNNGGPFKPPFCNYVENAANNFYNIGGTDGPEAEKIRMMTFVTDSYQPPVAKTGTTETYYDLTDDQYQPWTEGKLKSWNPNAMREAMLDGSTCLERLKNHLPLISCAALYDYLDRDNVPCSLAIPTVERAPMVCGINVRYSGGQLKVKDAIDDAQRYTYNPVDYQNVASRDTTKKLQYNIDGSSLNLADISVGGLAVYPFRHYDDANVGSFKVDGVVMLFLTSGDMGLRPDEAIERLKALDEDFYSTAKVADGVITLPLSEQNLSVSSQDQDDPSKLVEQFMLQVKPGSAENDLGKVETALLTAELKLTQTADPIDPEDLSKGYNWENPKPCKNEEIEAQEAATVTSAECRFVPLAANGSVDGKFQKTGKDLFDAYRTSGTQLKLNMAVVVRVRNKDNKVVDMVPATGACDAFNNVDNSSEPMVKDTIAQVSGDWTQGETPLMRLDTGAEFTWGREGFATALTTPAAIEVSPKSMLIADPRFNYAPESWFRHESDINSEQPWIERNGAKDDKKDGDIFLQVSDQCRLQSVYELANLPRLADGFANGGGSPAGDLKEPPSDQKKIGDETDALNRGFMWKTYDPFGFYRDDGDGFEELHLRSDGGGFKVNPYSDSTNVLMAAFANTPHDWRCAYVENEDISADTASAFNSKYAWNEYSSGAKLYWDDLAEVAGEFMAEIRAGYDGDEDEEPWEKALKNLAWERGGSGKEQYILENLDLDGGCKVYNTDRKFLYGFWHDCFSARQQLFLVFVRAEPVMMGGGAIGQTPPQLGARAVALVWRDPKATTEANAPHRTRILFYRQFD